MSNVVNLEAHQKANQKFDAALTRTVEHLKEAAAQLHDDLVNLAMAGPWREWDEAQPEGTRVFIDTEKLLQVGDVRVKQLAQLLDHVLGALQAVRGSDEEEERGEP